jgi:hypothetical protein
MKGNTGWKQKCAIDSDTPGRKIPDAPGNVKCNVGNGILHAISYQHLIL